MTLKSLVPTFKVKATIRVGIKSFLCNYLKLAEANVVKLSKKCKPLLESLSLIIFMFPSQGHNLGSEIKISLSNYSEKYQSKFQ